VGLSARRSVIVPFRGIPRLSCNLSPNNCFFPLVYLQRVPFSRNGRHRVATLGVGVPKIRGTHNQRLRKTKLLPTNETSQNGKGDTSTTFRLVQGTLDGMPRLRSDSYDVRSTGRLDRVPTRTRLARQGTSTIGKSPTRTTLGRATRPTLFTNSETKVRAFNATTHYFLPSWL
jgi:hypothetical protein